jgi:hypothetical protein
MASDANGQGAAPLTSEEVRRLCGDIVDWKVSAILASGAGPDELETCLAWMAGADDVMGEERKPLSGRAAALYDILTADDWDDPDRA